MIVNKMTMPLNSQEVTYYQPDEGEVFTNLDWHPTACKMKSKIVAIKAPRHFGKTSFGINWLISKGQDCTVITPTYMTLATIKYDIAAKSEEIKQVFDYEVSIHTDRVRFFNEEKEFDMRIITASQSDSLQGWIEESKYVFVDDADQIMRIHVYQHFEQYLIVSTNENKSFGNVWNTKGGVNIDFVEVFQDGTFATRQASILSNEEALKFLNRETEEWKLIDKGEL